jgi:phosphoglycerate dehydrogenase-like enzyme
MPTILIGLDLDDFTPEQAAYLNELADGYNLVITEDESEMRRVVNNGVVCDIEIAAARIPRDILIEATGLRWFQQWSAGADWVQDNPDLEGRDVIITSGSGIHGIPISEHIFMFLLAFARGLPAAQRAQMESRWHRPDAVNGLFELAGKTMLCVGVGAIGSRTAEVARAMQMHTIGVRRNSAIADPAIERMVGADEMLSILPEADFVINTLPGTNETRKMFGENEFRAMNESAYYVNIGRGRTVDTDALVHALQSGEIAGAGLDVTDPEPLPADSPLWQMENVIITGHYAGTTPEYNRRAIDLFLDNLSRYVSGEALRNVVDWELGY